MLDGERVSVAADMLLPLLLPLPPLQETRPPKIKALATSKQIDLKNRWRARV
jgi:hypothetical protein